MKIKLKYQVRDYFRSNNYVVRELIYDCDPNKTDRENLDDAFGKACELGAEPNKQIRWGFIEG
jgi:hypothetical protein